MTNSEFHHIFIYPVCPMLEAPHYFWKDSERLATRITVAIDLEWYDQTNGQHPLEIGLCVQADNTAAESFHLIVQEYSGMKNRYCPTSKLGFIFGSSIIVPLAEASSTIKYWLSGAGNGCFVDLVWHNAIQDERVLALMGVRVDDYVNGVFDTGSMFIQKYRIQEKRKLEHICNELGVTVNKAAFHNAGNDAYYTMMAYNRLC